MAKAAKERMAEMRTRQRELGRNSRQFWLTLSEENELRVLLQVLRGDANVGDDQSSKR
jgi:hypothetical protein